MGFFLSLSLLSCDSKDGPSHHHQTWDRITSHNRDASNSSAHNMLWDSLKQSVFTMSPYVTLFSTKVKILQIKE